MFHTVVRFSIDRLRLGGLQEDIPATHLPTDLVTWAIAFNCRHLGGFQIVLRMAEAGVRFSNLRGFRDLLFSLV